VVHDLRFAHELLVDTLAHVVHLEFFVDLVAPALLKALVDDLLVLLEDVREVLQLHGHLVLARVQFDEVAVQEVDAQLGDDLLDLVLGLVHGLLHLGDGACGRGLLHLQDALVLVDCSGHIPVELVVLQRAAEVLVLLQLLVKQEALLPPDVVHFQVLLQRDYLVDVLRDVHVRYRVHQLVEQSALQLLVHAVHLVLGNEVHEQVELLVGLGLRAQLLCHLHALLLRVLLLPHEVQVGAEHFLLQAVAQHAHPVPVH
jgi:hypothetical protein